VLRPAWKACAPTGSSVGGSVQTAGRGADKGAWPLPSLTAAEVTALQIAISAAVAFAPQGAQWEMPERAVLEVAFELSGERLALTLISRSPDPAA
jgi:hypothetical protein